MSKQVVIDWLEGLIEERGLKRSEVAELTGISATGIYNIIKRGGKCRLETAQQIAQGLGYDDKDALVPVPGSAPPVETLVKGKTILYPPDVPRAEALENLRGEDCRNREPSYCVGCYAMQEKADGKKPTRAMCRLAHGFVQIKGVISPRPYEEAPEVEIPEPPKEGQRVAVLENLLNQAFS